MRRTRSLAIFFVPLLIGILATTLISSDSMAQTGRTVLRTDVRSIDFGTFEVNSNANPTRTFTVTNNDRVTNTRTTNQVNVSSVPVNVELESDCDSISFTPTRFDLTPGASQLVEVRLRNINSPGPLLCSIVIVSSETITGSNTAGGSNTNIRGINSPFLAVEVLANISAPRLQLSDFKVTRTQRAGTRTTNRQPVTITQQGNSSSSNTNLIAQFGSLGVFEEAELTFEIRNNGNASMNVQARASNSREVSYRGAIGNNISIPAGESREIEATIRSIDGGNINSTLTISTTGSNTAGQTSRISLRLTATGNTINIVPNRSFLTFEARVPVDDDSVSASEVSPENSSENAEANNASQNGAISLNVSAQQIDQDSESFTLRNEGEGDDSVVALIDLKIQRSTNRSFGTNRNTMPFEFEGGEDDLQITLGQGESETIEVIYDPSDPGIDQAQIDVTVKIQQTNTSSNNRVATGQTIQEFVINLRGIAIPDNRNVRSSASQEMKLAVQNAGVAQISQNDLRFQVQGQGIDALRAEVFNLAGASIYNSGFIRGNTVLWNTTGGSSSVANGVYVYRLIIRGHDGTTEETGIKKLLLMR